MIRSMTGFGRSEISRDGRRAAAEIRTVNNRYLDLSIRMPRKLNACEPQIRNELKAYLRRGKAELSITYEDLSDAGVSVRYHREVAAEYVKYLHQMGEDFDLDNDIRVSSLSRFPEIFTIGESAAAEDEELWPLLREAVCGAAAELLQARSREGEFLQRDLLGKLGEMSACVAFIEEKSPDIIAAYREKLTRRVQELLSDAGVEENRILQEVVIYADKICVDEELVRLRSHIGAMETALRNGDGGTGDGIGRRLDFLAQEMNREANTILSKSDDLEVSDRGIILKTLIEQIREQVQNVE
ncbi:YicC/YloC family endoribonuclease [Lachnoclostridium sp. Marseille-P6806]|uniref:YicC/YloC family endoribonuclease n=1 Tax=Lachnoclostridium sp. Marseille-P6806 TaxID=2364793 RepID=UPI0010322FFD|nr:YicC/YloC family endoribonuclease [Lachnoclostridium sp. Marseille-P6806]